MVGQPTSLDSSGAGVASDPSKTDGDPILVRPMTANKTPTPPLTQHPWKRPSQRLLPVLLQLLLQILFQLLLQQLFQRLLQPPH